MSTPVPEQTVRVFARTIVQEAKNYGFSQADTIRLVNAILDSAMAEPDFADGTATQLPGIAPDERMCVEQFPLTSSRLRIHRATSEDEAVLAGWMGDDYGQHFLLSCASAQQQQVPALLANPDNELGIVSLADGTPIGAVAYLDINRDQRRAELRKLIGAEDQRGKGYAEEATLLWLAYGTQKLALEKIYVSTLQTHIRNVRLNESVGFRVEGVLRGEVLLDDERHDVLRMGLCTQQP